MSLRKYEHVEHKAEFDQKYPASVWKEQTISEETRKAKETKHSFLHSGKKYYYVSRVESSHSLWRRLFIGLIGVIWSARKLFIPLIFDRKCRKYWFSGKVVHKCISADPYDTIQKGKFNYYNFGPEFTEAPLSKCPQDKLPIVKEGFIAFISERASLNDFRNIYLKECAQYQLSPDEIKEVEDSILLRELEDPNFNYWAFRENQGGLDSVRRICTEPSLQCYVPLLKSKFLEMLYFAMTIHITEEDRKLLNITDSDISKAIEKASGSMDLNKFYCGYKANGYALLSDVAKNRYKEQFKKIISDNGLSDALYFVDLPGYMDIVKETCAETLSKLTTLNDFIEVFGDTIFLYKIIEKTDPKVVSLVNGYISKNAANVINNVQDQVMDFCHKNDLIPLATKELINTHQTRLGEVFVRDDSKKESARNDYKVVFEERNNKLQELWRDNEKFGQYSEEKIKAYFTLQAKKAQLIVAEEKVELQLEYEHLTQVQ